MVLLIWTREAKQSWNYGLIWTRKFDFLPVITGSNIDLGPKIISPIASTRREQSAVFFSAKLYDASFGNAKGGSHHRRRWENTDYGRGLTQAPLALQIFHHLLRGGGVRTLPRISRLLFVVEKNGEKRSKLFKNDNETISVNFSLEPKLWHSIFSITYWGSGGGLRETGYPNAPQSKMLGGKTVVLPPRF